MFKRILKWMRTFICTFIVKIRYASNPDVSLHTKFRKFLHLTIEKGAMVDVGENLSNNENVFIRVRKGSKLIIGKNVALGNNMILTVRNMVKIDDDVMFGPNVLVFDHDHDFKSSDRKNDYVVGEIYIGKNVWIGGNVTILKNSYIGENSVIAAGAVVNGTIPDNYIYYGHGKMKPIDKMRDKN